MTKFLFSKKKPDRQFELRQIHGVRQAEAHGIDPGENEVHARRHMADKSWQMAWAGQRGES